MECLVATLKHLKIEEVLCLKVFLVKLGLTFFCRRVLRKGFKNLKSVRYFI